MNRTKDRLARGVCITTAAAGLFMASHPARAQDVQHLSITVQGGMPGVPLVTGIERGSNTFRLTWDGPSGYYQLLQKRKVTSPTWQSVGGPNLVRQATVSNAFPMEFFEVTGPAPQYAGVGVCVECHDPIYQTEKQTPHAGALGALTRIHQDKNPNCLPCHTVGYGLPTGFSSVTNVVSSNQLAGVQCENCHGPGGIHAANENDPTVRPRVELAATVCGGCHNKQFPRSPNYTEWVTSGHAAVVPETLPLMISSTNLLSSCGRCHSGSARLSLVKGEPLPVGDADVPVVCAVCHDPHANHVHTNVLSGEVETNQVRYPVSSTNDYFLSTSTNFAAAYNPNINVCAQCHNHRGASWRTSDRAPHHSPQYNILLGTVGELPAGVTPNQPAAHALRIEDQCVGCHMQTSPFQAGPPQVLAVTGHRFEVDSFDRCLACHPFPELLVDFTTSAISNRIQEIKADLDLWAMTKAPDQLRTNYGVRSWEYTEPGELSNPAGVTTPGPNTADQNLIPKEIKKARFNLYLVLHDGSFGVHNAPYCAVLLETAEDFVRTVLNP